MDLTEKTVSKRTVYEGRILRLRVDEAPVSYTHLTAMFCAIIIALTFIPYTGYITYGLLSITTLHIPVLLGTTLFPKRGLLFGTVWGVTCLLYALANGTADAAIFLNPLISVVPRMLVGLFAGLYFIGFSKLFSRFLSPAKAGTVAALVTAVLGTLTNTALVLSAISLFGTCLLYTSGCHPHRIPVLRRRRFSRAGDRRGI